MEWLFIIKPWERRKLLMTYEKAMAEVIELENTDVITTSGGCSMSSYIHGGCNLDSSFCSGYGSRVLSVED